MTRQLVVITGTSSGLGRETAKMLLSIGYSVVGISRRMIDTHEFPGDYSHLQFDLSKVDEIPEFTSDLIKRFGKPYGLINNAAIGTEGMLPTMHTSEIEELISVNVLSPILLTKYMVRPMLEQRKGRIVNVSSIVARTGYRGLSVYGATKAAMEGFTRSLARDIGPRNVTVNCIAPGFVDTEMTSGLSEENVTRIQRRAALGRFPTTLEVASGIKFLLDANSDGITGTTLTIDAGNTA